MKLKSLNAWLKLGTYLRDHQSLPDADDLEPHLNDIRARGRAAMAALVASDTIAPVLRHDSLYWSRLNLTVSEAALLRADTLDVAEPARQTFESAWSNYLRSTFEKSHFY